MILGVLVPGGAGAFPGDHAGADGVVGGACFAEEGARWRGDGAAEDGVVAGVGGAEAQAALGEDAEAAPFGVFGLHVGIQEALGGGGALFGDDAGVGVEEEGAFWVVLVVFGEGGEGGEEF